jgi:N-acylglucosamine 2-epimerase
VGKAAGILDPSAPPFDTSFVTEDPHRMNAFLQRYERELADSVIPFWEDHCVDRECGGFFNSLDRDGSVYDTDKYLWMQWRIVYMFAVLAKTRFAGAKRDRWLAIARDGFAFLMEHGRDEGGSFYFALNREGKPIIAPYNIGTEFFAIMACAALYRAVHEGRYRDAAAAVLQTVLGRLDNPKGPWNKRLPADRKRLAHEDRMATVNLGLELRGSLDLPGIEGMVDDAIDSILDRFWRPEHGVVLEHLDEDFAPDLSSCAGRLVSPGHGLESAWFILKHSETLDRRDRIEKACVLIKSTLDRAWDREHGGIFYFMDVLGRPPAELEWDMKLWWVHCEALVATITGYALTGDRDLLDWFEKIDEWTWRRFPDPVHGEWYGYLSRRGEPTHLLKGGRWKCFFHLPRALLECTGRLEKL